ncbi:MAG: hypothetical protein FRX48_01377 [Lasallia pustulata]|uniref:DUF159 domain protein n=1 Tax=Lasallia pustulata TaxID=136370 RepID=A0A5M8PYU9_9LECA|nr:MAG: hypothetical protein FRX48_01377 [Lasallia pustulata]
MCGRYALGIRATFVRHQFEAHGMPVADTPDDDDVRQTYNFAPGYHGLVYRADVPDYGAGNRHHGHGDATERAAEETEERPSQMDANETRYKIQAMKWGLVPFWTKRNPDYGSVMKTINARDDSLKENRGMWNTMKKTKRCIVVAQGFYEWLKKNGGKEKIPHFVKRKDDQLMCFAGLWDCVQYEGSEEKHYTYTIITTDSNKQLKFLHDRMPVILENGSDAIRTWLDPKRCEWSKELQTLLRPYEGELECYPVSKDVGKVGNNSPDFIIPVASTENKNNIANFFSNAKGSAKEKGEENVCIKSGTELINGGIKFEHEKGESRATMDVARTEDNAPVPVPASTAARNLKRAHGEDAVDKTDDAPASKVAKSHSKDRLGRVSQDSPEKKSADKSPEKSSNRKTRSATSNNTAPKHSPGQASNGSQKITNFFTK